MQTMFKKFLILFLCAFWGFSLAACSGPDERSETEELSQNTETESEAEGDSQDPLLGPDATDEELLEILGDDIRVVTDDEYVITVKELTEDTKNYCGKIYQLEGVYTVEDGNPYVRRTLVDGSETAPCGLMLKYQTEELEEGSWIRVTGIINEEEVDGETAPVLEILVIEPLEEQGQVYLQWIH